LPDAPFGARFEVRYIVAEKRLFGNPGNGGKPRKIKGFSPIFEALAGFPKALYPALCKAAFEEFFEAVNPS
jgi:hypothetical protein